MDKMTLEQITDVLIAMEEGDIITFNGGAIAHRIADGWEVTLPEVREDVPEPYRPGTGKRTWTQGF